MVPEEHVTPKEDWSAAFLVTMRLTGNVKASCEAAGISRNCVYARRDRDEQFAERWSEAIADAIDGLEQVAWERGKAQSDSLIIFLLKSHRPALYRETVRKEVSGPDGGPVEIAVDDARSQFAARIAAQLERQPTKDGDPTDAAAGAGEAAP